jgi:hypothetical protein
MHCKLCDALLTDYEATMVDTKTDEYIDTCCECTTLYEEDAESVSESIESSGIITYIGNEAYGDE